MASGSLAWATFDGPEKSEMPNATTPNTIQLEITFFILFSLQKIFGMFPFSPFDKTTNRNSTVLFLKKFVCVYLADGCRRIMVLPHIKL
jgi:hypothetical protein